MAAGHSYGELPALAAAGAIEPADLLNLSRQRALSILDAVGDDPGYMAAVSSDRLTIAPLIEGFDGVVMANQNSPAQVVISGPTAAMDAALQHLKANGLACKPIATACAFHSPQLSGASVSSCAGFATGQFEVPFISCVQQQDFHAVWRGYS